VFCCGTGVLKDWIMWQIITDVSPLMGLNWFHVTQFFIFPHEIIMLVVECGFLSSLHSMACNLLSPERRDSPRLLDSIVVEDLTTNLPSCC
jgi:hypothetical protein